MKRIGRIIVIVLVCSLLIVLCPNSAKAVATPKRYSLEEVSESVGYVKLSKDGIVRHVTSAFLFYKEKGYTYVLSCYSAHQEGYTTELVLGSTKITPIYVGGSSVADVAVFRYESSLYNKDVLHFATASLQEGQRLYSSTLLGYESDDKTIKGSQEGYVAKNNVLYCDETGYLYNCVPLLQLDMYLTDNSHGGPILNEYGYVVGMSTFKSLEESNINLAVYSQEIINFANRILAKELLKRADLGLYVSTIESLTVETQESLDLTDKKIGTVITAVKGKASGSGLAINQLILAINGNEVHNAADLIREVNKYNSGSVIKVKVQKVNGQIKTYKVKV